MLNYQRYFIHEPLEVVFTLLKRHFQPFRNEQALFTGTRVVTLLGMCALMASLLATHAAPQAFAIQAKPPTDKSFYMNSSSTSEASTLGCNQGKADTADGRPSEVVLAFGGQLSSGSGTEMTNGVDITNAQIEAVAEKFSYGYWDCTGTSAFLSLGIGTNNNISVTTTAGKNWANMVKTIASYNSSHGYDANVEMYGADDMEPGFGSASAAIDWAKGFSSVGGLYLDFGSADGCPTSGTGDGSCNHSWTEYDEWYLSYGNASALPTPEIYNTAMAHQWATISLYAADHQSGAVYVQGPWDEYDEDTSTLTATQAWDDLWTDLNANSATKQSMLFSLEIYTE